MQVKIGGRTFRLGYTVHTLMILEEKYGSLDTDDIPQIISKLNGLVDVLYALAYDGAQLDGKELDVNKDWLAIHIPANQRKVVGLQVAVIDTVAEANRMESEEDEDLSKEVDVVLQELQKKRTDSRGDKLSPTD